MDVGKVDGYVDNAFQFESCGLQNFINVIERSARLGSDPSCGQLAGIITTLLPRDIKRVFPALMPSLKGRSLAADRFTAWRACPSARYETKLHGECHHNRR